MCSEFVVSGDRPGALDRGQRGQTRLSQDQCLITMDLSSGGQITRNRRLLASRPIVQLPVMRSVYRASRVVYVNGPDVFSRHRDPFRRQCSGKRDREAL